MKTFTEAFKKSGVQFAFFASLIVTMSASTTATAQTPGGGGTQPKAQGGGDGYGYSFEDDPLSAGGLAPADATIKVRPGPVRTTLIRPRTSFVPEMLKSVENL